MKTCKITYSRNDVAKQEWFVWLHGYPESIAVKEVERLLQRNKDFDFRVLQGQDEEE